jgi:two-component system, LytTR family, response regulator
MNVRAGIAAVIAEDEPVARQAISAMADACGIKVMAECKDGAEAIQSVQIFRPDILFLDVQMPGIDGFAVLQGLAAEMLPAVIFTTAFDRYAVRAFELNAVDYLLKPFDEERFEKAVNRAKLQLENRSNHSALISRLADELQQAHQSQVAPQRLVVRSKGKVQFLRIDEIDWIEAQHNYLRIHVGGEVHTLRQTVSEIETRLHPDSFLRIHRSLIVNVDRIRCLEACGYGEYLVVLQNGKSLPLSRGYRDRLDRLLEKIAASTEPSRNGSAVATVVSRPRV